MNEQDNSFDEDFFETELTPEEKAVVTGKADLDTLIEEVEKLEEQAQAPADEAPPADELPNAGEQPAEEQQQSSVPHAALHQERERRKEAQEKLLDMEKQHAALEAKLDMLNKHLGFEPEEKAADDGSPIDPDEDLFGAFKQLQERYSKLEEQVTTSNQTHTQERELSQLQSAYVADVAAYRSKEAPDFEQAYNHLQGSLDRELQLQGVTDPNQRQMWIKSQEIELARNALANNQSPASIIYGLAKERGFVGGAPVDPAAAPTVAQTTQNVGNEKLSRIAKAQSASATLTGKSDSGKPLTLEALAEMDDDEIAENSELFHKMLRQASS